MSIINQIESPIKVESPKIIPNEVLNVYVPENYLWRTKYLFDAVKRVEDRINGKLNLKVDTITINEGMRVYSTDYKNGQGSLEVSITPKKDSIVMRNSDGRIDDEYLADKNYVDTGLSEKVNLPSIGGYTRIPVVKPESAGGEQGYHSLTASNVRGTVMFRDSETGRSKINTPVESDDIANKGYVDSREVAVREDMTAMNNKLSNELSAEIDEVESIAKGATQAESFFNYEEMLEKLNVAPRGTYRIGQSLFINTHNVPDLWVSNKVIGSPVKYTYTSDESFVEDLKDGRVTIGYYTLAPLETQKVDLTEYPTTEEVASIVKSVTYDKEEIDTKIGDVETALDELHSYAQALVTGGNA